MDAIQTIVAFRTDIGTEKCFVAINLANGEQMNNRTNLFPQHAC
jgi:hypothetical protein